MYFLYVLNFAFSAKVRWTFFVAGYLNVCNDWLLSVTQNWCVIWLIYIQNMWLYFANSVRQTSKMNSFLFPNFNQIKSNQI